MHARPLPLTRDIVLANGATLRLDLPTTADEVLDLEGHPQFERADVEFTLEDEVFVGPSAVFTNVRTPRAHVSRRHEFVATRVGRRTSPPRGLAVGRWGRVRWRSAR